MAYDNNMSGVLFRNNRKQEGSKAPDYNGKLEIDGTEYELAGWIRESKAGNKFLSIKAQLPRDRDIPEAQEPYQHSEGETPF